MMNYLLKELYSNDDIQSYATSIEYLRKLEEFDESEIRLKFLLVSYLSQLVKKPLVDRTVVQNISLFSFTQRPKIIKFKIKLKS